MYNPAQFTPYHEKIAARANQLWQQAGCPNGCEIDHWLQAEKELTCEEEPATSKAKPPEPPPAKPRTPKKVDRRA